MQVPKRKPGKFSSVKPDPKITQKKHDELIAELEHLIKQRPDLSKEVQRLAAMGDFSENAGYQIAKGKLRGLNYHILEVEDHLRQAIIIGQPSDNNTVQLCNTVTFESNGKKQTYLILGSSETNPDKNIISHNSPLGSALMGHKVGDTVSIMIDNKEVKYKILKIE